MEPFQVDVRDLQDHVRNVAGPSWLGDVYFRGLPDFGTESDLGVQLGPYQTPSRGTTILLVTDLGIGQPRDCWRASRQDWNRFMRKMASAGCRVVGLLPYGRYRWPQLQPGPSRTAYWGTNKVDGIRVRVRDFARMLSVASVLDGALIRAARRALFPTADAGTEADLLFSRFIAVSNARVVTFRDEMLRELRSELAERPEELEKALDFLFDYRAASTRSELLAWEEKIIAASIRGAMEEFDQGVARVVRTVLDHGAEPRLARWAAGMVNGLPPRAADRTLSRQLRLGSTLRLGILPAEERFAIDEAWLLPDDATIGVSWSDGDLILRDPPLEGDATIDVPGTVPRHVHLRAAAGESTRVQVWPGQRGYSLPADFPVELATLSGVRYQVTTKDGGSSESELSLSYPGSDHARRQDIPQTLRERLRERRVIPFVGPGVSMAVTDRETGERLFPSWRELLLRAADRLDQEHKSAPAGLVRSLVSMGRTKDLLVAADEVREALGSVWFQFLKDQIDLAPQQGTDDSLALARFIWGLNSNLVLTTNYDDVLRWAHPTGVDVKVWNIQPGAEQADLFRGGVATPAVWHLHGHIGDAARLILTPGGYAPLYPDGTDSEARYKAALRTLRTLFTSHTCLFVGYSTDDEQLAGHLGWMHEVLEGATGPHYMLVHEAEKERVASLGLPIEILTFSNFGRPLVHALSSLSNAANEAAVPPLSRISGRPAPVPSGGEDEAVVPGAVFLVPFLPKGADVVGREAVLQAVRKQLTRGRRTQIGQTAAFQGLGGLGKTQLAVEYAYRFRGEYPGGVIWLAADQDIDAQLTELASKAGWIAAETEHRYKLDVANQRLRTHTGLLVFDNVESQKVIEPYLPARDTGAHVLVTSRTEQPGFVPVPLDLLDMEQSVELLIREAGRAPEGDAEQEALREVAANLGGLPLALELAGAFIRHRAVGWGLYRDRLKQQARKVLSGRFLQSATEHESDLFSTLQIDEEVFAEEPLLKDALDVLAWSGPAPMGVALLSSMLAMDDPTELTNALGLGVALRLLHKTPGRDSYSVHRLLGEVWRESHPLDNRPGWVRECCSRLGDWFQHRKDDFLDLLVYEAEIDHLRAWQGLAAEMAPDDSARLLWLQAYPLYHRGEYRESLAYVERAHSRLSEQQDSDRELYAYILSDLGTTQLAIGAYHSALGYAEQSLAIRQELFGERHPETAASLDNVGSTLRRLGGDRQALEYAERALAIRQELFGERHPETAASLDSVGTSYRFLGEPQKALEYAERALAIRQELFGERHPDTARPLNNIGTIYSDLGDHHKAMVYQERALAIRQELLGEDHPDTASSLHNLGITYGNLGEKEKALRSLGGALTLRQRVQGDAHPDTVTTALSLASTLHRSNQRAEAFEILDSIFQKLERSHPSYAVVQETLQALGSRTLRPGFRQPSVGKKTRKSKKNRKKKR
jgi:tetratricopeptide (TPR) repeat protein